MKDSTVDDLVQRVSNAGVELSLYYFTVVMRPPNRLPTALHAEVLRRTKEVRAFLASKLAGARSSSKATHKWVIRLGDLKAKADGPLKPAILACGPVDWCMTMIRQSTELSDPANKYERARWLILEQDQVGAPIRDDRGILVASTVVLPEGVALGGPKGSSAEIISACEACLTTPMSDEKVAEIVKNDD